MATSQHDPSEAPSYFDHLGPALRWLRKQRGLTMRQVADAAGLSRGRLGDYECERYRPHLDVLARILRALDVTVLDMIDALEVVGGRVGGRSGNLPTTAARNFDLLEMPAIREALGDQELTPGQREELRAILTPWVEILRQPPES